MTESFPQSFGTDVSGNPTVAVASGSLWVSVAELLAHQVPVQSSEAVALVAELCAVLLQRSTDVIPHAADVLVNDLGRLSIRGEDGDPGSAALGRLLHSLFATTPAPAPLRLFASLAISSERYQSVSAFAEALASYEVAGRNKLIQAVHQRWVATRAAAVSSVPVPALPEPEPEKKSATPNTASGRLPRWAIATVSVAVIFAGATGAWLAAGAKPLAFPAVSLSVPAAIHHALAWLDASTSSDTTAVVPEIKQAKGVRAAKPRKAARVRTSNAVLDVTTPSSVTETAPASEPVEAPVTTALPDGVTLTTRIVSDTPASNVVAASRATTDETPGTFDDVAMVDDVSVYSSATPDVKPPVIVTRQIAPAETLTSGMDESSTIELLVDASGGVERVRLLSRPSPILATMLLSAAKTWTFRPALNDGRPVKYRLLLDVMVTRR
jgi:hypothetical protein